MNGKIPIFNASQFEIVEFLGKGTYGLVYLARDKTNDKLYAVKQSIKECKDNEQQKMFDKEIISCSKVQSPAILKIEGYSFDVFNNIDYPTIFSEYMPNKSLDKYLKKDPNATFTLTPSQKYIILLGISIGMKVLHSHGIIHRDIKPGNILLDEHFFPHIGDFGISNISNLELSQILMSTEVGTPLYQAPEILSDEGKYNYKIDIYSFSLILYQIITGILPFSEYKSPYKLQQDVISGKRPDLNVIENKSMRDFLELCWSNNPSKRPSFDDIIEEILGDKYKEFFNVNENDIEEYLSLFNRETLFKKPSPKIIVDLNKKAMNGDSNAMLKLAIMYDHGDDNVDANKDEAIRYYKMSCENENSEAMMIYCNKLMKGDGIPVNKEEAAKIYKIFADKGNTKAMNNYGIMLLIGDGIAINKSEASFLFKNAADQGEVDAMYNYGVMLFNGDGIQSNKNEAKKYIQMAINHDYSKAKSFYEENMKSDFDSDEYNLDLSRNQIGLYRLATELLLNAISSCQMNYFRKCDAFKASIVFYDGLFKNTKYIHINPCSYFGKIPGLYEFCWKYCFSFLNEMKSKYPNEYESFVPKSLYYPKDIKSIINLDLKKDLYIIKRRNYQKKILHFSDLDEKKEFMIQEFISPYLIDEHKFDLRIYFVITNLKPLTMYRYEEGIAYFCIKPFNDPDNTNSYFINKKSISSVDSDFKYVRRASEVIKVIAPKNKEELLMKKIEKIGALTVISLYKNIVKKVNKSCEINDSEFKNESKIKIKPLNRFFNLIAIDLIIDKNGNPFIFDVCSNPGLKPLNDQDEKIKLDLIKSEFELIFSLSKNQNKEVKNWKKILPSDDESIHSIIKDISHKIFKKKNCHKKNIDDAH